MELDSVPDKQFFCPRRLILGSAQAGGWGGGLQVPAADAGKGGHLDGIGLPGILVGYPLLRKQCKSALDNLEREINQRSTLEIKGWVEVASALDQRCALMGVGKVT